MRLASSSLVIVLVSGVLPSAGLAQTVSVSISECTPHCPAFHMRLLATLGAEVGEGELGRPSDVARLTDGSWALTDMFNSGMVKVYGPDGGWMRTIGRAGRGPGEFSHAMFLHSRPDGLEIYDQGLLRVTRLDTEHEVVDTRRVDVQAVEMAFFEDGALVANAQMYTPTRAGLPLVVVDPSGRLGPSFGADPPITGVRQRFLMWRNLSVAPGQGAVWSAVLTEYRAELWGRDGLLRKVMVGALDWFPPGDWYGRPIANGGTLGEPFPGLVGVQEDVDGVLWLLFHRPDPRWAEAIGTGVDPYGRSRQTVTDQNRYMDTVVKAVDLATGRYSPSGSLTTSSWAGQTNESPSSHGTAGGWSQLSTFGSSHSRTDLSRQGA